MNTAMSTKRSFVSSRNVATSAARPGETTIALYALVAGILLMIIGSSIDVALVAIAGFFFTACAGLTLNAMFWAGYFEKHGTPKISVHPYSIG